MRIVFMGTPDFSVPTLKALVDAGHDVAAVVTQPDKPKGRGKEMQMTPVKVQALEYKIPVYQPVKVRDQAFIQVLREMDADVFVVIAFGQILPKDVLELPRYGCVNIHASLLPKYRGAAPIQWCVIDGEKETGITTMMMDVGLDTGDMLEKTVIPIEEKEDLSYIREAVLKLPDKYKSVIYLFYYEGYTAVEIAGILHKKENTIYTWMNRGRQMLKEIVGGDVE